MIGKECPHCLQELEVGEYFDYCNYCDYELDKREQMPLYAPSPFDYKRYEMRELHREGGYSYGFYEHEPLERNDEPHIHVKGQGKEIEYYLSNPIREKYRKPQNFPEREE